MRRVVIDSNLYRDWLNARRHQSVLFQQDAAKYLSVIGWGSGGVRAPRGAVGSAATRGAPRRRQSRMDRVRLAIVGCGNICQLNAPGYLEHPRCDVVALCDTDRSRAERRACDWGLSPRSTRTSTQLLDDSGIDAIELLTPTYLHAEQIIAALAAGKHVSCQKPLAGASPRPIGSSRPSHGRGPRSA